MSFLYAPLPSWLHQTGWDDSAATWHTLLQQLPGTLNILLSTVQIKWKLQAWVFIEKVKYMSIALIKRWPLLSLLSWTACAVWSLHLYWTGSSGRCAGHPVTADSLGGWKVCASVSPRIEEIWQELSCRKVFMWIKCSSISNLHAEQEYCASLCPQACRGELWRRRKSQFNRPHHNSTTPSNID